MKRSEPQDHYRRRVLIGELACIASLAALTIAVTTGVTDQVDISARERFRPGLEWSVDQQRALHVVAWLAPTRMMLALAIGTIVVGAWRRTLWPLVQSAFAVVLTAGLTLALKLLLERADPKGEHTSLGGSFPSGHSAVVLVCLGTGAMLVSCPTRWWQRLGVALVSAASALAMMFVALHWLTDIVGGVLVAGTVLGLIAFLAGPDGGPSHRRRPLRLRSPDRSTSLPSVSTGSSPALSGGSSDVRHRP